MIKQIIRITWRPLQTIFDAIRRREGQRKMMAHALKINQKFSHRGLTKG